MWWTVVEPVSYSRGWTRRRSGKQSGRTRMIAGFDFRSRYDWTGRRRKIRVGRCFPCRRRSSKQDLDLSLGLWFLLGCCFSIPSLPAVPSPLSSSSPFALLFPSQTRCFDLDIIIPQNLQCKIKPCGFLQDDMTLRPGHMIQPVFGIAVPRGRRRLGTALFELDEYRRVSDVQYRAFFSLVPIVFSIPFLLLGIHDFLEIGDTGKNSFYPFWQIFFTVHRRDGEFVDDRVERGGFLGALETHAAAAFVVCTRLDGE